MEKHWERADVHATLEPDRRITIATKNVTALTLNCQRDSTFQLDGQTVALARPSEKIVHFKKTKGNWEISTADPGVRKRPGTTGPIDDAFVMEGLISSVPPVNLSIPKLESGFQTSSPLPANSGTTCFEARFRFPPTPP